MQPTQADVLTLSSFTTLLIYLHCFSCIYFLPYKAMNIISVKHQDRCATLTSFFPFLSPLSSVAFSYMINTTLQQERLDLSYHTFYCERPALSPFCKYLCPEPQSHFLYLPLRGKLPLDFVVRILIFIFDTCVSVELASN